MIALATTGGIILGKSTVTFLFNSDKNIALVALLTEQAYLAPTYSAITLSNLITALLVAGVTDGERKYYTLGCDNRSTIEDVWNIIAQNLGGIPIEYDDSRKLSDMETRSFTSDYTEFRALTGWNAKYTIRYGIRETVEQIKRVLKDDSTF